MAKPKKEPKRWDIKDVENGKYAFNPILKTEEMDLDHTIHPKAALKMVQVVEHANMNQMFKGYERLFTEAGFSFSDIGTGEFILFINGARDYIKMLVGTGSEHPVIIAYRLPPGMTLPSHATKEVVRSLLKKGDIQADDRLRAVVGESLREARERLA